MKKLLIGLAAIFVSSIVLAQTQTENYVKTTSYQVPVQDETEINALQPNDKIESITYYDGLGRPEQSIAVRAGNQSQDIITPIVYDQFGRQTQDYLPYSRSNSSLDFETTSNMLSTLNSQYYTKYQNDIDPLSPNPFSEKVLENSPLNTVLEQAAPGKDWAVGSGHTIKFDYQTNSIEEVKQFSVSHPNNNTEETELVFDGYYAEEQLYKTITKDENWISGKDHTTEEFKNKQGQVLLKRTYNQSRPHDTQYVYDDFGNLTYVLPPTASDEILTLGNQGFKIASQNNYSWVELVQVDKEFAEDYNKKLSEYSNQNILNADIENEYGGQGGFSLTTSENSEQVILSISFSSTSAVALKQGELVSLKNYGEYKDTELGRITGSTYEYFFYIRNNAITIEGRGEMQTINQTFNSDTKLVYSKDYLWTTYTDIDPKFATTFERQVVENATTNNQSILSVNIDNQYGGQGGLNISIDENDTVSLTFNSVSSVPLSLKQGVVLPLDTRRRISDRELGTLSGTNYSYNLAIKDNSLFISGEGLIINCFGAFNAGNPPIQSITPGVLEGMCYIYHYDHRNRLIEKKIPGKGWEYIVYNNLDLPVLTQDAKMRLNNDWLFTKYDPLNRVVYTGKHHFPNTASEDNAGRLALQDLVIVNGNGIEYRKDNTSVVPIGDMSLYYSNKSVPRENIEVYTVNYYDDYPLDLSSVFSNPVAFNLGNENQETTLNTKALATGSRVRILGTSNWITTATYYDDKARNIFTGSQNTYLNTIDVLRTQYDFVGKVLKSETKHLKSTTTPTWQVNVSNGDIKTLDEFTYDHTGRLLTQSQSVNDAVAELIVNNTYDELGQLLSKKVGGAVVTSAPETSNGLQTVNYTYNIRGWLKTINNDDIDDNDLFNFKLNYKEVTPGLNSTPLYNGNISETHWETANDNNTRHYTYEYDTLNRLTRANYNGNYLIFGTENEHEDYTLRGVSYDKNGNITSLNRYGFQEEEQKTDVIDDLKYYYQPNSNKLLNVVDSASKDGFNDRDEEQEGNDYAYDINGNMVSDQNKGITKITYNHLNLPESIIFNNDENTKIRYFYDATGVKQEKVVFEEANINKTKYAGNYIYENNDLKFFSHPEGYLEQGQLMTPFGGGEDYYEYNYIYQYKDHLGNIRLSYSDADKDGHIDTLTPGGPSWTPVDNDGDGDYANEIIEENNYYPFGLEHKGYNNVVNGTAHPYKFGGKEHNEELGLNLYDFGARNYQPDLGRWMNIDPMADRNYSWTPYRYAYNNPLKFVDPDGLYERDGHYWTVYLAGMVAGRNDSGSIAYWAEEPDHVMSSRGDVGLATNTWMYPRNQRDWHALTGGNAVDERARSRGMFGRAGDAQQRGYALHRLGDSYAHSKSNGKMYPNGIGHALQGHAPDKIANRPELYLQYVNDLVGTLGGDSNADLFAFDYVANSGGSTEQNSAVFETEIRLREGVKTFSVLGDQTGVIGDYMCARNENYGTNTSYKTVTAEADSYKLNKKSGEWEKSGTETRTFVIFN